MPITPRGIVTPNDPDPYDLVLDLAAMGTSIDAAFDLSTPLRYATAALLLATTPANGTRAIADNVPGAVFIRVAGAWQMTGIPYFATTAAADTALTAPLNGWKIQVGTEDFNRVRNGSNWASLGPFVTGLHNLSSGGALPTSTTTISGSSSTFTLDRPMATTINFGASVQCNGASITTVNLSLDGSVVRSTAAQGPAGINNTRWGVNAGWSGTLAAGSHTVLLSASNNTASSGSLVQGYWMVSGA